MRVSSVAYNLPKEYVQLDDDDDDDTLGHQQNRHYRPCQSKLACVVMVWD